MLTYPSLLGSVRCFLAPTLLHPTVLDHFGCPAIRHAPPGGQDKPGMELRCSSEGIHADGQRQLQRHSQLARSNTGHGTDPGCGCTANLLLRLARLARSLTRRSSLLGLVASSGLELLQQ